MLPKKMPYRAREPLGTRPLARSLLEPRTRMDLHRRQRRAAAQRGYTLIELMVVVAMIGVLAAIAIVGYRRYTASAGTAEALAVIQGIRNAEETYKAETLLYLGCSGCGGVPCASGGGQLDAWFPMTKPTSAKVGWNNSGAGHADAACWQMLNIVTDGPVRFGYAVIAGVGSPVVTTGALINPPTALSFPTTSDPWFVVQAAGDRDDDSDFAYLFATSFQGDVYVENDGE
jgi:type IV pilus assembly protein PilA